MSLIDIFHLQNPWRKDHFFCVKGYVEREILKKIEMWVQDEDVLVILGPRQSGKTTILKKLVENLLESGVKKEALFYFNLDDEGLRDLFKNPSDFVKFIHAYSPEDRAFIFIDEVQRVSDAGLFLKTIYDLGLNLKLIVSGSSSLEITAKVKEYLTGRKKEFKVYPLSFREVVGFKRVLPAGLSIDLLDTEQVIERQRLFGEHLLSELKDFIVYGGYPKVLLRKEFEKKEAELSEIYSSYVQKDVKDYLNIERVDVFNRLVTMLAYQIGNLVNKQELSVSLQVSWVTIEKYLGILEETFVIGHLPPYYTNRRKEITKMKKVYYIDTGLRNFIAKNFMPLDERADTGSLFENIYYAELAKKLREPSSMGFWRTQAGAEVDFVMLEGERTFPVEIKATKFKRAKIPRSFKNFLDAYKPEIAFIATMDFCGEIRVGNSIVKFIPLPWLLYSAVPTFGFAVAPG